VLPKDSAGLVALVLAVGVMIAFLVIATGAVVTDSPLTQEEQTLIATITGAALGAVSTYIGIARGDASPPTQESQSDEGGSAKHPDS
jgi:hypothetical protein